MPKSKKRKGPQRINSRVNAAAPAPSTPRWRASIAEMVAVSSRPSAPVKPAQPVVAENPQVLSVAAASCAPFEDASPQSVGVTCWFEAPTVGPDSVPIHLVGQLEEPNATAVVSPGAGRTFDVVHEVRGLPAGIGRVAATIRITDVVPGRWRVTAEGPGVPPTMALGSSAYAPVMAETAPGVSLGAWAALVATGALVGVALLAGLAARAGLDVGRVLALALAACLVGLVGAKVYFVAQARTPAYLFSTGGMCIQGFVMAALLTLTAGARVLDLPALRLLDLAVAPLLVGMAIGRLGCWKAGCCAGRLTTSRWGVWGSDRYIGGPRMPTQLLEGAGALILAVGTAIVVVTLVGVQPGILALFGLGAYVLLRQLLLPLRAVPRRSSAGRTVVLALSAAATSITAAVILMAI